MINIGDRFGMLTASMPMTIISGAGRRNGFLCLCDCGKTKEVDTTSLLRGNNKSCGCLIASHRMTGTRIYVAWTNMKRRCNDPTNKSYASYGGKGITYDDRWEYFENFYEDMGDSYDDLLTLDRVDVDGDYIKENCRWVDFDSQMNNMTTNRMVSYQGETLTMSRMARKHGLTPDFLKGRIYAGWTIEDAIEKPIEYEMLTFNGETKTVTEFAEVYGLTYYQLKKRLMRGWTVERAITQPLRKPRNK